MRNFKIKIKLDEGNEISYKTTTSVDMTVEEMTEKEAQKERERLAQNGYNFVNEELTWDNKFDTVYGSLIK